MSGTEKRTVVAEVDNAKLWSDGSITLEECRASYPHVFEAQKNTNEAGVVSEAFSIQLLMPKATHRAAKDLCKRRYTEIMADNGTKKNGVIIPLKLATDRLFIKDGDTMAKDECVGQWVVSAREQNRPALRGNTIDPATGKPQRLTDAHRSLIFGGCYVSALIRPWFQNNTYGKRINAGLSAVQYLRPGEPFGEGRIGDDDIDDSFSAVAGDTGGWDDDDL